MRPLYLLFGTTIQASKLIVLWHCVLFCINFTVSVLCGCRRCAKSWAVDQFDICHNLHNNMYLLAVRVLPCISFELLECSVCGACIFYRFIEKQYCDEWLISLTVLFSSLTGTLIHVFWFVCCHIFSNLFTEASCQKQVKSHRHWNICQEYLPKHRHRRWGGTCPP